MPLGMTTPPEADIAEQEGDISPLLQSSISGHISRCWEEAKQAKQQITERLLKCERQRRGEYDPEKIAQIRSTGGSDVYMMLTDIKCRAAKSWITDVMFSNGQTPFELEPSRLPELPPEMKLSIVDHVRTEAEQFLSSGESIHPDSFRNRMEEVEDVIRLRIREEAKEIALRMKAVITDQLDQGGFKHSLEEFIDDFVTYPSAILKGPSIRKKRRLTWGPAYQPMVLNDFSREVERVSPYDVYPSPSSSNVNDGYLIQRHRLNLKDVESLKGVPGYRSEEIEQVLIHYGTKGFVYQEHGDTQQDELKGKLVSRAYTDNIIEALEFWGPVMGSVLKDWGLEGVEDTSVYEINAWQIGSHVIKVAINPDPLGRRPYEIASWSTIPGAFWGQALPETMSDIQAMCNAAARSLANNMGIASGPQVEVAIDRLPDGEDVTTMHPWKLWQTTSDRTGGGQAAIRFFQPDMNASELMGVYQAFAKQSDEITGVPNYIYGSGAGTGAGRTASGLSMLMDNAAKGIKSAITRIDYVVTMVVERFYVHNMLYNPDPFIKGDFRVVAKGAMGLIAKEAVQSRRNEFLAATANPVDLQIIGMEGRAYLLREMAAGLQMDTDKIVPSPEMLKFKQQQMQMQQMQLQQAQMTQQPMLEAPQTPAQEPQMLQETAPAEPTPY
ncbi:hypothetical protein UFOVP1304_42 [uncultured Caudovirales phage]|uniref:Portal protein n=1 Tax=uncultured Caudovirales phage TaxID=2100421 RepID=A0A6J5RUA8_9CAUD|nr:hypothetical protein UFOVP1304_42 [uncultured Caudovirales phage]